MATSIASDEFIGRERELAELHSLLDETNRGTGGIALVAGEPGIGKTFLLSQVKEYARAKE